MTQIRINERRVRFNSLLLALVIHLLIINSVIIIFKAREPQSEPIFVFLGSILQTTDIMNNLDKTSRRTSTQTDIDFNQSNEYRQHPADDVDNGLPKPGFATQLRRRSKTLNKTIFYDKDNPFPHKKVPDQILGVDIKLPDRKPMNIR
jgi:hypothetical protein